MSLVETVFEGSGAGILAGNSFRGNSMRLGTVVEEAVEFSRAVQIVSRRKARMAFAVKWWGTLQGW